MTAEIDAEGLVERKLRERAAFMREAGQNDDADLDEQAATALQSQADALAEARRMVALAEEAEEAAKDCFWAVYPTYIKATGKGIITEAAHTELSARATTAEASLATMRGALEEIGRVLIYSFEDDPGTLHITFDGQTLASIDIDSEQGSAALKLEQELAQARDLLGGSNAE